MPTLAAASRLKSATVVRSAFDEFRSRLIPRLEQRPVSEGLLPTDYRPVLDSLQEQLSWDFDNLFEKDTRYVFELSNDSKLFTERTENQQSLTRVMVRTKNMFDNCYDPANIEEYGFPRKLSQDPEILNQQARHLNQQLRVPDLPVPDPLAEELRTSPEVYANVVEPHWRAFDETLKKVRRERRAAQLVRLERNEALEHFDQTFLWVARTAESLFNLVGENELAKRVRPSTTRPGRTETDPDQALAGQEEPTSQPATTDTVEPTSSEPPVSELASVSELTSVSEN